MQGVVALVSYLGSQLQDLSVTTLFKWTHISLSLAICRRIVSRPVRTLAERTLALGITLSAEPNLKFCGKKASNDITDKYEQLCHIVCASLNSITTQIFDQRIL